MTCADAGSSLLRDLPRLERIARQVVAAVPGTPVTGKIRIGWDAQSIVAVEAAQRLEAAGAQAIGVHGRTKEQGYRGQADWDAIADVVSQTSLPVIGNGGLEGATDIERARQHTGMRGAMIGRAALGNPWLFAEIKGNLQPGADLDQPYCVSLPERWRTILDFAATQLERQARLERDPGFPAIRSKVKALTKGLPGGRRLRAALDQVSHLEGLRALAEESLANPADLREVLASRV